MNQQIDELKKLLSNLNIHDNFKIEKDEETNEIIFEESDNDSEFETKPIKEEQAEPSHRYQYNMPSNESLRNTGNKQGYTYHNNKFQKIPEAYRPKVRNTSNNNDLILNLDCVQNGEDLLQNWVSRHTFEIIINESFDQIGIENIHHYLLLHTSGDLNEWLTKLPIPISNSYHPVEYVRYIGNQINMEYFGKHNDVEASKKQENYKAAYILTNIQLCNICHFDEFVCQLRIYYNKLGLEERKQYLMVFVNKLPCLL